MQRKTNGKGKAWMLHQRDAITTNNDAVQKKKIDNEILEALEGTITDHELWKVLIGKVQREGQLSLTITIIIIIIIVIIDDDEMMMMMMMMIIIIIITGATGKRKL